MIDHSNREDFLNAIAEKAGRPRHQLKDHPFVPLNDLPEHNSVRPFPRRVGSHRQAKQ